jgi:hypothetical protein
MSAFLVFYSEWPALRGFLVFRSTHLTLFVNSTISTPFLVPELLTLFVYSTLSTPLLVHKTVATSFLAGKQRLFKLFRLYGECVCIHCFDRFLVSAFINETQVSSPVTRTM